VSSLKEREQFRKDIETGNRRYPSSFAYLPACTKVVRYEEILMLTGGLYPNKYVPLRNCDEMFGILVSKRGNARLYIGREFEPADQGHKAVLILQRNGYPSYWMDTGIQERMNSLAAVKSCPQDAKVLVSGLGLGVVALKLARSGRPVSIHVCELERDVIRLIWPRVLSWCKTKGYTPKLSIECTDVAEHLKQAKRRYNYIYLDIWPQVDPVYYKNATDMKTLARKNLLPKGRVTVWQIRQMRPADQGIGAFL